LVTAATIYLSLLGDEGLKRVALQSHTGMKELTAKASSIEGVKPRFTGPVFHEQVLSLPVSAAAVVAVMARHGVLPGLPLDEMGLSMPDCLLVNVTETKTSEDIARFTRGLAAAIEEVASAC
jgi:glycine dehydrogenase subunit 1